MLVALLGLVALAGYPDVQALQIGDPAPALDMVSSDGQTVPADFSGEVVIVDFFATWCGPCHRALRDLVAIQRTLGSRVRIVLVDAREDPAIVQAFFAENPLPGGATLTIDVSGAVMRRWGCTTFPTTYLVDGAGIVRHINRGWGGAYHARILRWLRVMLGDLPATKARPTRATERPPRPPAREVVKGVEILRGPF